MVLTGFPLAILPFMGMLNQSKHTINYSRPNGVSPANSPVPW
jgi:hypothetical protein